MGWIGIVPKLCVFIDPLDQGVELINVDPSKCARGGCVIPGSGWPTIRQGVVAVGIARGQDADDVAILVVYQRTTAEPRAHIETGSAKILRRCEAYETIIWRG